jgi:hypothetical protein
VAEAPAPAAEVTAEAAEAAPAVDASAAATGGVAAP